MTGALLAPAPFESLQLPDDLDGSRGSNRAVGKVAQIAAINDLQAIQAWLARFADTRTTFDSYRKEAERLYLWAVFQLGRPVSSLTHEDLLVYQRFLGDPQPREKWVAGGGRKHPRGDPRWRPFYGPLSLASQRQTMVILNVMFAWLVQAGYLAGNPLSLARHRARRPKPRITRYLDVDLWQEVKVYIEGMPCDTERQRAHHFRAAGCSPCSISADCGFLKSAATRWARSSVSGIGTGRNAGGWKCSARARRSAWYQPATR